MRSLPPFYESLVLYRFNADLNSVGIGCGDSIMINVQKTKMKEATIIKLYHIRNKKETDIELCQMGLIKAHFIAKNELLVLPIAVVLEILNAMILQETILKILNNS